jgi:hypothetical protein
VTDRFQAAEQVRKLGKSASLAIPFLVNEIKSGRLLWLDPTSDEPSELGVLVLPGKSRFNTPFDLLLSIGQDSVPPLFELLQSEKKEIRYGAALLYLSEWG